MKTKIFTILFFLCFLTKTTYLFSQDSLRSIKITPYYIWSNNYYPYMFSRMAPTISYLNNITSKNYNAKGLGLEIGLTSLFPKFHFKILYPILALDACYLFKGENELNINHKLIYQSSFIGPKIGLFIALIHGPNFKFSIKPFINYYFSQNKLNDNNNKIIKIDKRIYVGMNFTLCYLIKTKTMPIPLITGYSLKLDDEAKVKMNQIDFPFPIIIK